MLCAFEGITDILPPFGRLLLVIHLIIKEANFRNIPHEFTLPYDFQSDYYIY